MELSGRTWWTRTEEIARAASEEAKSLRMCSVMLALFASRPLLLRGARLLLFLWREALVANVGSRLLVLLPRSTPRPRSAW